MRASSKDTYDFLVLSNRLPVDRVTSPDGTESWQSSPGGLVTALEPVMRSADGAWVGWVGQPDLDVEPFDSDGIRIVPVRLSALEVEQYYEGFSNDTLWPLYHDVIAPPSYHREWWDAYLRVNQRFADAAAAIIAPGGTVWVQDYQLQLVPKMLRAARSDITIGFFNHIPFPPYGIYSQLPWRTQIIEGLLGADVIGFQRAADASNFSRAVRRLLGLHRAQSEHRGAEGERCTPSRAREGVSHLHRLDEFRGACPPASYPGKGARRSVRAWAIRSTIMLGVDRLDYTKGIGHRLKAYGELLAEGRLEVEDVTLVQVASPSRERVAGVHAVCAMRSN